RTRHTAARHCRAKGTRRRFRSSCNPRIRHSLLDFLAALVNGHDGPAFIFHSPVNRLALSLENVPPGTVLRVRVVNAGGREPCPWLVIPADLNTRQRVSCGLLTLVVAGDDVAGLVAYLVVGTPVRVAP